MLNIIKENDSLMIIDISGKIDADAMDKALDALIDQSRDYRDGALIYRIGDFQMPTLGAMVVELRKMPQLFALLGRFKKVAVLAEKSWIRTVSEWEGMLIPGLEIKAFLPDQEKQARDWLAV